MRTCVFLSLCLLGLLPLPEAKAFEEKVTIASRTLRDEDFLRGDDTAAAKVSLQGSLSGPDTDRRLPVVILLHGTDGPGSGAVWTWQRSLDRIGVATFALDSYTGRGLKQASTDQSSFQQFTQIYDTYRAIEVLADHPKVDPSAFIIMGFSRGGTTALYSAMTRFQTSFGPTAGRIAAHFPFYPACNFRLEGEEDVGTVPIRQFHGTADDWTPIAPCQEYFARLGKAERDATITALPGARHAFDNARSPAHYADADWQTSRNCLRIEKDGSLINAATGKPFSYDDACVEYGPSVQYNDAATTTAQSAVKDMIGEILARR